jgi:hypothetical protein
VKLKVPFTVGMPDISPVELFKERPAGKEPEITDQVYGAVPPTTPSVLE